MIIFIPHGRNAPLLVICMAPPQKPNSTTSLQTMQSAFVWNETQICQLECTEPGPLFRRTSSTLEGGGGDQIDLAADCVVLKYDINEVVRKWKALPPSPVAYFALAAVNKSLTLVGGWDCSKKVTTGQLTVWDREQQQWGVPFPSMPTPRQDPTAIAHQLRLLVAGGMKFRKPINIVELCDCATFQWHTAQPLPWPSAGMTSCVIRNTWYLLGGTNFSNSPGPQKAVFSLFLDDTIASNSWNVLPDTDLFCSTAVAFGDYLMSVGGTDSPGTQSHSSTLFIFSPALEK